MDVQPTILLNVFLVTVIAVQCLRPAAARLGFIDAPGAIKRHEAPTPACGGLAIVIGLAVAAILGAIDAPVIACLWVAVIAGLGALDDLRGLSARLRLGAQFAAAALLAALGPYAAPGFGEFSAGASALVMVIGLTLAFVFAIGVVNSFNLIDGLDGLAGAVALAALFWLAAIADIAGDSGVAGDAGIVAAAVLGFLVFNLRHPWRARASVFLGDAGSTAIGAVLACLILALASGPGGAHLPALVWLVVLPLIDMASLVVRRIAARRSPFSGDRQHLHHLLLDLGLSPGRATLAIAAASFACGAVGYLGVLYGASATTMIVALAAPVAIHSAVVRAARPAGGARPSGWFAGGGSSRLPAAKPVLRDEAR